MSLVRLIQGDALAVLETLAAESFDACLCDPPYGYNFMGRRWDHGVPSAEVWREVLRCLRPGASLMAFGGCRTYHRLAVAVEDAGFEIRDSILVPGVVWVTGQGFPKSLNFGCRCESGNAVSYDHERTSEPATKHRMRPMREGDLQAPRRDGEEQGQVLFSGLPESCLSEPPTERSKAGFSGREQSGLEGRELHRTGEGIPDDEEARSSESEDERICAGAHPGGGRDAGSTPEAGGGGAPRQSPEGRQSTGEPPGFQEPPGALGDGAPGGRSGCPRCGGVRGFDGYGTSLKPSHEPVVWAMKPVDGTFARNALEHGVAGINVDGGRIAASGPSPAAERRESSRRSGKVPTHHGDSGTRKRMEAEGRICSQVSPERYLEERPGEQVGRYPSNVALVHLPTCQQVGTKRVRGNTCSGHTEVQGYSGGWGARDLYGQHYADPDGTEEVAAWKCVEGCPVLAMDRASGDSASRVGDPRTGQSGSGWGMTATGSEYADSGTASRFFQQCAWEPGEFERTLLYYAKAPTAERMVDGERLLHPTMKPLALATYLARLLLPPPRADGEPRRLLVPFSGVGSEVIGALRAGWDEVTAIELDADGDGWIEKSSRRIVADAPLLNRVEVQRPDTRDVNHQALEAARKRTGE